tara:strand:+ start:746 stop:976 length:231 start_codon:yes stop_codon:yes gene_type:complete
MGLKATIIIDNADAFEVEGLLLENLDDYFSDVEVYEDGRDVVVEVYSRDEDAGDQTADFLEDNGYYVKEYIIEDAI